MALSNTTLVNVDADTAPKIVDFIASKLGSPETAQGYAEECKKHIETVQTAALMSKLLEHSNLLLDLESDAEVDCAFQAMFSITYILGDGKQEGPIVQSIIKALTSNTSHAPRRRLAALVSLFNLSYAVESKVEVLTAILTYALAASLTSLAAHLAERVDGWIVSWELSAAQQRELFKHLAKVLSAENQHAQSLQVTIKYLQTHKDQALSAEALAVLQTALISAVQSPLEAFNDRVALYEAVLALNVSGDSAKLLALLKILCDGSLADFHAFRAANAALLASNKLNGDDLEHKLRILTICSLAAQSSPKRELSFAAISAALMVDISDVEIWVVEAIAAGLLEASINQLQSTVTVSSYSYRSFGTNDWRALQKGLRELSQQLASACSTIQAKAVAV